MADIEGSDLEMEQTGIVRDLDQMPSDLAESKEGEDFCDGLENVFHNQSDSSDQSFCSWNTDFPSWNPNFTPAYADEGHSSCFTPAFSDKESKSTNNFPNSVSPPIVGTGLFDLDSHRKVEMEELDEKAWI